MIDELLDTVFPGGAFLAAGVALGAAFGKQLRPVAKEAIKLGFTAGAALQELAAEAYERGQDLVAEARHEHDSEQNGTGPDEAAAGPAEPVPAAPARQQRAGRKAGVAQE